MGKTIFMQSTLYAIAATGQIDIVQQILEGAVEKGTKAGITYYVMKEVPQEKSILGHETVPN